MPCRRRHAVSRRSSRFSKRALFGAVLAGLILAAGVFLYSDGSLSSGFAVLGKVVGVSLGSLGQPEQSEVAPLPSVPAAALGAP